MAVSIRFPVEVPEDEVLDTLMILNDTFIIPNVKNNEVIEILLPAVLKMRPIPLTRIDLPTKVTYTIQSLCDVVGLKSFYVENLGKSIKMNFESNIYYGYMSELLVGEEEIDFSFTYTSKTPELTEDRFFSL